MTDLRSRFVVSLRPPALALVALVLFCPAPRVQNARASKADAKAAELLARAETMAERGSYRSALAAYRKIVQRYPKSPAAVVARRRSDKNAFLGSRELTDGGPPQNRLDIVIFGEGFTLEHQRSFDRVAKIVPRAFQRNRTFREYGAYLRFVRANVVSAEDGIDGLGRESDTAFGAFLSDEKRAHMDIDHGRVRAMLGELPQHDGLAIVFVRAGQHGLGSHGTAVLGPRAERQLMHEWGHAFAGLGEEHSDPEAVRVAMETPANLCKSPDPSKVPWAHWIEAGARGVGVYQGGDGQVQGVWKPMTAGCVMDDGEFYCTVCRERVVLRIYDFVDPIDSCDPEEHESSDSREPDRETEPPIRVSSRQEFELTVLRPRTHALEVTWWLFPQSEAPEPMGTKGFRGPRSQRPPLPELTGEPLETDTRNWITRSFTFGPKEHPPGRYKLVCRVRDTTQFRGEKLPWVLKDPKGVLESRRAWVLEIVEPGG